jgi:hypothetical protein
MCKYSLGICLWIYSVFVELLPMAVKHLQFLACVVRNSKRIGLVPCPGFVLGPCGRPVSFGRVGVVFIKSRPYLMICFTYLTES